MSDAPPSDDAPRSATASGAPATLPIALAVTGPLAPGETGGAAEARLTLHALALPAVVEIGAWPGRLEAVSLRLEELAALPAPGRPGRFAQGPAALLGWVAFGRFLWLSAAAEDVARLEAAFDGGEAAVVDLTGARVGARLVGSAAADLLNKAVAIDFSPRAFPPGALAQTVIHDCPVLVLRRAPDAFDLLATASLAQSLIDWLRDAALEFGYRVGEPVEIV